MEEVSDKSADLIFTCPPYFNLERYESVPGQLSDENKYESFMSKIDVCISNCYRVLKSGAFACWVVGDLRTGGGFQNFHGDVINSFKKHGFNQHDIVILENISPFAALQIGKTAAKRYTSKVHEYLLVFRKPGDYEIPKYCSPDELEQETKLAEFFK
jgi:DNA modification methylase